MTTLDPLCFVVMPFRPEFNYFYLYLQTHLRENHQLRVERGDHRVLTKPLIEKIREQIRAAHVLIADITGANPNVLYEVGLAHAYGKPVVFLTQDPPEDAPVDLRQFEFIPYTLGNHKEFLERLDNAMHALFADQYAGLFELARTLLDRFNGGTRSAIPAASEMEFQNRIARGARTEGLPSRKDERDLAEFLLPKIVHDSTDIRIMKRLTEWLDATFDSEALASLPIAKSDAPRPAGKRRRQT